MLEYLSRILKNGCNSLHKGPSFEVKDYYSPEQGLLIFMPSLMNIGGTPMSIMSDAVCYHVSTLNLQTFIATGRNMLRVTAGVIAGSRHCLEVYC